jgi:hypothetical protein
MAEDINAGKLENYLERTAESKANSMNYNLILNKTSAGWPSTITRAEIFSESMSPTFEF